MAAAKLGKEWRFRKSIIDHWLDEQILSGDSGFEHLKRETQGGLLIDHVDAGRG